ncbi:mobilization protein [Campylobacter jejuni]
MAQISSINFKKSNPIQTQHNDRDLPPSYLIGGEVECNLNHQEALALKNQIIKDAIEAYTKNTKQKFQAKSYEWSAVVNIKPDTTMNDLKKLAEYFEKIHGFQCYQIAIHRDEGHINEQGEKVINHHAHMEFITLDKQTGKNRQRDLDKTKLRSIQTAVSNILKMERGVDKRKSGVKRIEPRAYAVLKEKEKREKKQEKLLNKSEYKQIIENFRKEQAGKGFTKEFFKDLSELKKNFQEVNETSLSELLNDILEKHREYIEEVKKENIAKIDNTNLNAQNEPLNQKEQKNDTNIDLIKENQFKSDLKPLNELEKENQILKNQIEVMKEVFEPIMRRWKNQAERIKKIDIILPNEKEKTTKEAYEAHIKLEKLSKVGVFAYDNAKIILDKINQFIKTFQNKR